MSIFSFNKYSAVAFVLAFIFCGAIVGETLSISLAVSALGSSVISKLYLINGVLLYSLPLIFFNRIDRVDRGKLLSKLLLFLTLILLLILAGVLFLKSSDMSIRRVLLFSLYPFSYLTKTTLFLTFWTLANDVFPTSEAKKTFPIIAAWGMAGGVIGAYAARQLVAQFHIEAIFAVWVISYFIAWIFSEKVRSRFKDRLRFREDLPSAHNHVFSDAGDILTNKLVRLIAISYFLVFIAIFSFDYLFWKTCYQWFSTPETLASFQFTFYLVHACATIAGLWLLIPYLINRIGFTKLFYFLPTTLFVGTTCLYTVQLGQRTKTFFIAFLVVQFFRYVVFENAFSPIYQMFFAAIEKEKRGRAKTLLEGIIKPGAILSSGLLIMLLSHNNFYILGLIMTSSALTIIIVYYIRRTYSRALIPEMVLSLEPKNVIANVTHFEGQKLQSIVKEYAEAADADMRIVSVKILAGVGSHQAFETMVSMYEKEENAKIKEFIAKSVGVYHGLQTRSFIERLLEDHNPRIRANALNALNKMHCNWKRHLKSMVSQYIFDGDLRVQVEAARFLWENFEQNEKDTVAVFLSSLLSSTITKRKSAGVYLLGILQPKSWEQKILDYLLSSSMQVFTRCVEVILLFSSIGTKIKALRQIETLSRDHIATTGVIIERIGESMWELILQYLPDAKSRRMIFEMTRCLRVIADLKRASGKQCILQDATVQTINDWVLSELELVYKDCFIRAQLEALSNEIDFEVLDQAIRENCIRICEWTVNAMVLIDKTGLLIWRHSDIDIRENTQRMDLVEILESTSYQKLGVLVLPLLKEDGWSVIARVGKGYFHFDNESDGVYLDYFIKSDNRWLVLCAMRTMLYYSEGYFENKILRETLEMLSQDPNRHIAIAARDLLENKSNSEKMRSESFILLEKVLFFKKTILFRNVSAEKLIRLAEISHYAVYEKNTVISVQGEVSDHLYIVKKGSLNVVKSDAEISTIISVIEEGETYGEIGLFTQATRSASAVANESCEVYIIKRGAFKKLLLEVPEITYNLLETMSERLRKNGEEMMELSKRSDEDSVIQNSI